MNITHIVNISGGKDSTATYLKALERGRPFRAVWADTGHEHPATVEYIDRLPDLTGGPKIERVAADFSDRIAKRRETIRIQWERDGVPDERIKGAMEVLQPTGNPFLDLCLWKGLFPSTKRKFCTEELKVKPIQAQVIAPALDAAPVVQWVGVRREESPSRANTPFFRRVRWGNGRSLTYYAPLADWTWQDVFTLHDRHGIKPNPLYSHGANRVGCWPCIMCGKAELAMIGRTDPSAVEKLMEWERLVAQASKRGLATFFAADKTPRGAAMAKEKAVGQYPRSDEVFDWARTSKRGHSKENRQYDLMAEMCVSEYGLCE